MSLKWKETDHTDPKAYFKQFDKSIDIFRFDVQVAINKKMNPNEEDNEMIYNYIDDTMPEWARATIQKLVDNGLLKGNENGELGLNDTMLKLLVINDRAGLYN